MAWDDYFVYDADSGNLVWKERQRHLSKTLRAHARWNAMYPGRIAGHAQGVGAGMAVYVRVLNQMVRAHRIIWEMHHGPIPDGMLVDHVDGDYLNNRLSNLRLATKSQNGMNRVVSARNALGIKGVSYDKARMKYVSHIAKDGKVFHIGRFTTKGEAAVAYAKASIKLHGRFSPFMRKQITDSHDVR